MGAIGGMLGLSGGASGTGFSGPGGVPINAGTTPQQLQDSYGSVQGTMQQQQALLQALQGQGGIQNQSQVYGQLQGVANGTGPNPAMAMLNQQTGQNVANQAALMAGQRGASANAGLIARQAAQQGGQLQQNAIGQGASLQAQQSLNALGAAGSLANQQVANQIGVSGQNVSNQQQEQQILQNANTQANNANVTMQGNVNNVNGQLANTGMQGQQGLVSGALNSFGGASSMFGGGGGGSGGAGAAAAALAGGGVVSGPIKLADGGSLMPAAPMEPQSSVGRFLASADMSSPQIPMVNYGPDPAAQQLAKGWGSNKTQNSPVGKSTGSQTLGTDTPAGVPNSSAWASFSGAPGTTTAQGLPTNQATYDMYQALPNAYAGGGSVGERLKSGGGVPGQAKVAGNSYANDTVRAKLSPGEGVIDRETMADPGPAGQMARLLMTIVSAKNKGKK